MWASSARWYEPAIVWKLRWDNARSTTTSRTRTFVLKLFSTLLHSTIFAWKECANPFGPARQTTKNFVMARYLFNYELRNACNKLRCTTAIKSHFSIRTMCGQPWGATRRAPPPARTISCNCSILLSRNSIMSSASASRSFKYLTHEWESWESRSLGRKKSPQSAQRSHLLNLHLWS